MKKRLKIGWFSFTGCEGSVIMFTELLNDYYSDWFKLIEFKHMRILQKKNKLKGLDVAFVEGAISSEEGAEKLKEIRDKSRKVIAIGSCAINGMPSSQRNMFGNRLKKEIDPFLKKFNHLETVVPLYNLINVDGEVPGCPMDTKKFLKILNKMFQEFKIA